MARALDLLRNHHPSLLIVDVNLAEGSPAALLAEARRLAPSTRIILVAPASRPPPAGVGPAPDVTLLRPFRIRQFAEALAPPSTPP